MQSFFVDEPTEWSPMSPNARDMGHPHVVSDPSDEDLSHHPIEQDRPLGARAARKPVKSGPGGIGGHDTYSRLVALDDSFFDTRIERRRPLPQPDRN